MLQSIPTFMAQAPGGGGSGMTGMLFLFIGMIVFLYVFSFRPQQKKQKLHQEMLRKLKAGDKVITTGGIYGTIVGVKDKSFVVKVADNVKIEVSRSSVALQVDGDEAVEEAKK